MTWGILPLLRVWPTDRQDAYNPLEPKRRRRPITGMTDAELRRLWPSIPPEEIRQHAPWATSREEVLRVAFPGHALPAGDAQVEEFVRQAVASSKESPWRENEVTPFEPNPPGPGAFQMRPLYEPPVIIDPTGRVLPPPPRPQVVNVETISRQLDWIELGTHELITTRNVEPIVTAAGKRVDRWVTREVKRVIEIDPRADPQVDLALRQWNLQNANLIESGITAEYKGWGRRSLLNRLSHTVEEAHRQGLRVEVLAHQLQEQFGFSDSRAALIARDQTLKLNGQLNRYKQQSLGIEEYIWMTSRDERVRKSHQKLQGTRQRWDTPPPETGHPGEDYQCRCNAKPVIPEFD